MGLVIVFVQARFGGYDALADPLGWALVLAGLLPLRGRLPRWDVVTPLGLLAGLMSLPLFLPAVEDRLDPSGQWAVGLPQGAFCVVLCFALSSWAERAGGAPTPVRGDDGTGPDQTKADERAARRLRLLGRAYVAVLAGPVLVYGGGLTVLATPVALLAVLANVALVWLVFAISRRTWALRPEVSPRPR